MFAYITKLVSLKLNHDPTQGCIQESLSCYLTILKLKLNHKFSPGRIKSNKLKLKHLAWTMIDYVQFHNKAQMIMKN